MQEPRYPDDPLQEAGSSGWSFVRQTTITTATITTTKMTTTTTTTTITTTTMTTTTRGDQGWREKGRRKEKEEKEEKKEEEKEEKENCCGTEGRTETSKVLQKVLAGLKLPAISKVEAWKINPMSLKWAIFKICLKLNLEWGVRILSTFWENASLRNLYF